jgi:type VI secretion system lysozyme-like protein
LTDRGDNPPPVTRDEYQKTIMEDLQRLLSTRCTGKASKDKNILNYGIPSVTGFSNDSQPEKANLARYIKEAIEECEPRLRNVSVEFVDIDDWKGDICTVAATMDYNDEEERFSFKHHLH